MEQHYFNSGFARDEFSMYRQWAGWQIPGMQPIPAEGEQPHKMTWVPLDSAKFVLEKDRQPYFKLHGASTWIDERSGRPMLIMGGDKPSAIEQHPILKWNYERFREYLSQPNTRLFVIDPLGVDVLQRQRRSSYYCKDDFFVKVRAQFMGASRRTMGQIFGDDVVEHGKVMRFFGDGELMGFQPPRN